MPILVVDVFEGNGQIDWATVKAAGVSAAIHKATQYRVDALFTQHHADIPGAGLHHGCYHFMAYDVPIAQQVQLYTGTIGTPGCFGWVIDFERYNGMLPTPAQLSTLLSLLPPGPVLLYGNKGDLATLGTAFNGKVKVWLADYGVNDGKPHGDPAVVRASTQFPASDVLLWQFTSKGAVDGIGGYVDVSMWLGTDAEWAAYVGESQPVVQPSGEEDYVLSFVHPYDGPWKGYQYRTDPSGAVYVFDASGHPDGNAQTYFGGLNTHVGDWHAGAGQPNGPPFMFGPLPDGNCYYFVTQDAAGQLHYYGPFGPKPGAVHS